MLSEPGRRVGVRGDPIYSPVQVVKEQMGGNCRDHNDDEGVVQYDIRMGIQGSNDEIAQIYPDKSRSHRMTDGTSPAHSGCVA